jgi:hypothetical protein
MERKEWKRNKGKCRNGQAISDCCMVAAESFCGIEQTTARVEPVEVLNWNPGCGLEPTT